jgi:hypothetical protein
VTQVQEKSDLHMCVCERERERAAPGRPTDPPLSARTSDMQCNNLRVEVCEACMQGHDRGLFQSKIHLQRNYLLVFGPHV